MLSDKEEESQVELVGFQDNSKWGTKPPYDDNSQAFQSPDHAEQTKPNNFHKKSEHHTKFFINSFRHSSHTDKVKRTFFLSTHSAGSQKELQAPLISGFLKRWHHTPSVSAVAQITISSRQNCFKNSGKQILYH